MHRSQCSAPPSKVEKKKKSRKHMVTSVGMCTTQLDLYSFVLFQFPYITTGVQACFLVVIVKSRFVC